MITLTVAPRTTTITINTTTSNTITTTVTPIKIIPNDMKVKFPRNFEGGS